MKVNRFSIELSYDPYLQEAHINNHYGAGYVYDAKNSKEIAEGLRQYIKDKFLVEVLPLEE